MRRKGVGVKRRGRCNIDDEYHLGIMSIIYILFMTL